MRLIVVGAGIVGTACAYTASRLGASVVVVDAAQPGAATAAGAGIVCPWSGRAEDPDWYSFGCAAAREYPLLIDQLAGLGETDVGYRRVGALALAEPGQEPEEIRQRLLARRAEAPEMGEVEVVDGAQAQDLFPPLRPGAHAVYIGGAARIDGRLLAAALTRAAVSHGAVLRTGEAQLAWRGEQVGGTTAGAGAAGGADADGASAGETSVRGVTVDGELIEADAVVAAAGAWTRPFLEPAGITVAVSPQRGQIAHIGVPPADTTRWPVILPGGSGHYLLAFDDSRVVAGATRETGAGFDYRVTPGGLAEVLREALAVAPGLAAGTFLETRVGFRPAGPDIRPLLGPVPGLAGLVVATGLGASGLTMGPYAGAIAARVAMGLPPIIDLRPFDPLRGPAAEG